MTAQTGHDAWVRLGGMLERRRVELDLKYRNLALFAEERGVDYRMAWDLEHARRTNYRRITLMAVELAYGWEPGSIEQVLEGGQPLVRDLRRSFAEATARPQEETRTNGAKR